MKKYLLFMFSILFFVFTKAQITYIGITNHNTGSGSDNLFNHSVNVGQQCYIDWEVYADGMTIMEPCGFRSDSRLILRRMADSDSTSVVASTPIIVSGICNGKNGNNDHYYVELSSYIDKPGRYSVEIQADLPNRTNPFGNSSTRTTNNYACPPAYYLSGTSGSTGNYYTPAGECAGYPGLSDPIGGPSADSLIQIFPALKFFTVGDAATYRRMIVFNSQFYDLKQSKFQPGNPTLPTSLNGLHGIPTDGICPIIAAPAVSLGAEINNFKNTNCGADVTGCTVFYRAYKDGSTAPAFQNFNLAFRDDCSFSPNGPEQHIFPEGGSCQNANGVIDQRWQDSVGTQNILPATFALADTGLWNIDVYIETYIKDCLGNNVTDQSEINTTTFSVNNPFAIGSPCSSVVPVILSSFTVAATNTNNILKWKVEEATDVTSFTIQQSFNGYTFQNIGFVNYINNKPTYNFIDASTADKIVYYRIIVIEKSGKQIYSSIIKINSKNKDTKVFIQSTNENIIIKLLNFEKGKYQFQVFNTSGSLVFQKQSNIALTGNSNITVPLSNLLAHSIYYVVIRGENNKIAAKCSFYY